MIRRDSDGQSLVEFALVLPVVMLLIAGLFDLGHVVFVNNSLSDGARHGARHATTDPRADDYCSLIDDAVRSAIRGQQLSTYTVTYETLSEGVVTNSYDVCVNGADGPDKAAMAADITAGPGDRVTVNLGADVGMILGFIAQATGQSTFNLTAESTMQVTFAPKLEAP